MDKKPPSTLVRSNWEDAFRQTMYVALLATLPILPASFTWSWAIRAEGWTWAIFGGVLTGITFASLWLWLRYRSVREYHLALHLYAHQETGGPEVPEFMQSSDAMKTRRVNDALPVLGLLLILLAVGVAVGAISRLT